ncbi:MAG: Primosomal protein N' [Chlamydiia bacterium]|nr:Primosomal protein N' [Chlamydiia bacterium]MCH9624455.1 Primosomal protein N' [Chlamydiia bacterium]
MTLFVTVLLDKGIKKALTYSVPDHLRSLIAEGKRVSVPIQKRSVKGTILSLLNKAPRYPVKDVMEVISEEIINDDLKKLGSWMSDYYATALPFVLKTMLPGSLRKDMKVKKQYTVNTVLRGEKLIEYTASIREKHPKRAAVLDILLKNKKGIFLSKLVEKDVSVSAIHTLEKKGIIKKSLVEVDRSILEDVPFFKTSAKVLNAPQAKAFKEIEASLEANTFKTFLLHGITGSGKTEVYLQAIEKALSQNKGVILLIPEIALTEQTVERFKHRFEDRIAVLNYRLSDGEKTDAWKNIAKGKIPIVIGARSAIFSPMPNVGLIIVDEEHELSYKQIDEMPCYNARDIAVVRGSFTGSTVILGSATPSLESVYNVMEKKYHYLQMNQRAAAKNPPTIKLINMEEERENGKGFTMLSQTLLTEIKKRIDVGEQVILFLNRRGYFSCQVCSSCNETISCPSCDSSLTYHRGEKILACHLCGYEKKAPITKCPKCGERETLKYKGPGTEQVERSLHAIFPEIRTLRMDRDTTKHKGSHETILKEFRSGKADLLIGTQMIAKGLDFPLVTLSAVIGADSSLHIPDYRSTESLFQVMTQVVGRSGRAELPGLALIQTYYTNHPVMQAVLNDDFKGFIKAELEDRKLCNYPPYTKICKLVFTSTDKIAAEKTAENFYNYLKVSLPKTVTLYKPMPCGYAKIKDKFRFQILLKSPHTGQLCSILKNHPIKIPTKVRFLIDIGATSTFS